LNDPPTYRVGTIVVLENREECDQLEKAHELERIQEYNDIPRCDQVGIRCNEPTMNVAHALRTRLRIRRMIR